VVNNVAIQEPMDALEDITDEQWLHTFAVNIHGFFWVTKAALPHLRQGSAIINTASVNGLRGNKTLIDYSATKAQSSPGPTRWRRRWWTAGSVLTRSRPARCGHR